MNKAAPVAGNNPKTGELLQPVFTPPVKQFPPPRQRCSSFILLLHQQPGLQFADGSHYFPIPLHDLLFKQGHASVYCFFNNFLGKIKKNSRCIDIHSGNQSPGVKRSSLSCFIILLFVQDICTGFCNTHQIPNFNLTPFVNILSIIAFDIPRPNSFQIIIHFNYIFLGKITIFFIL